MTLEELKEFMQDANNKAAFDELVKAAGYHSEDVSGLKSKNLELIGKLKKEKENFEELKKTLDNIDLEEYNALKSGQSKGKTDDKDREFKKLQDTLKKLEERNAAIESERNSLLTRNALSSAFKKFNIDPIHETLLTSAFSGKAKIEDGHVIIDDGSLGLPVEDFFKTWTESDSGKPYLAKPVNSGSGSSSFKSSGVSRISRNDFNQLSPVEQAKTGLAASKGEIQIVD